MFDVVTVPDFSGISARRFELMTLFLLASWIEYGGKSNKLPLHIAAIGVPPESVRRLAGHCGAEITTHSPLLFGNFANKLRGFEVNRRTDNLLLIDTDVLVFANLNDLPQTLENGCVAAAYDGYSPLTAAEWSQVYQKLNIPISEKTYTPLNVDLDTFKADAGSSRNQRFPYFNAGVVYAPWDCGLAETWRRHLDLIRKMKIPFAAPGLNFNDQLAFATAIAELQASGMNFQPLQDEYHVRWQHLTTGAVRLKNTKLLHAINFCRRGVDSQVCSASDAVDKYAKSMMRLTHKVHFHRVAGFSRIRQARYYLSQSPRRRDVRQMRARMKLLSDKYVRKLID